MEPKITRELVPCPVCGSRNIGWGGYYYVALVCHHCSFKMWSLHEFAAEDEFYNEWNNLPNLDKIISDYEEKLQKTSDEKEISKIKECLSHFKRQKTDIIKLREERKALGL